jgi:hypothetical protein
MASAGSCELLIVNVRVQQMRNEIAPRLKALSRPKHVSRRRAEEEQRKHSVCNNEHESLVRTLAARAYDLLYKFQHFTYSTHNSSSRRRLSRESGV